MAQRVYSSRRKANQCWSHYTCLKPGKVTGPSCTSPLADDCSRAGGGAGRPHRLLQGSLFSGAQAVLWKLTSWCWQPTRLFSQDTAPAAHNTTLFRGGLTVGLAPVCMQSVCLPAVQEGWLETCWVREGCPQETSLRMRPLRYLAHLQVKNGDA